ncbi:hypothetical protein [Burkholderia vietnamiensis]|uniref:hypothetical protein n=1 Tax=Burkholderia vietnamiensis TaxID=60552 RepID=UPI000B2DA2EB|nr:hypothetical protein [Burkholderia vietnamiensis]
MTNKVTATIPGAARAFDLDRKHGVGQFLRAHPDAARVMARMRGDSKGFYSIEARARLS